MNKEEIKAAAKNYSEKVYYTTPRSINKDTIDDFTAGAEWAAGDMEKDMLSFGKWVDKKGFRWSEKGKVWWKHGNPTRWTDEQILKIFKQQKP